MSSGTLTAQNLDTHPGQEHGNTCKAGRWLMILDFAVYPRHGSSKMNASGVTAER